MQDYAIQLAALNELRSFLYQFKDDLRDRIMMYKSKVESLRDIGLPVQEVLDNYLVSYYNPNHLSLHNLIERIESVDLPFINVYQRNNLRQSKSSASAIPYCKHYEL